MEHSAGVLADLTSAWWIALAAMAAPLLAHLSRKKVPDVVWLLLLGVIIGPFGLQMASQTAGISFVRELGLGILFFLAGLEIDPDTMRDASGRRAARTWMLCLVLGIGAGWMFMGGEDPRSAIVLGIASTSTALGTLLPILKDSKRLDTPLGKATMRHGAVGELGPIMAITLLLSTHAAWKSALILLAFAVIAALTVAIPHRMFTHIPGLGRAMVVGTNTTMQTTLRFAILILISLMLLSGILDLDVVLGAFMAGMLIKQITPEKMVHPFISKVETLGFSFLIPVFFVTSGMNINVEAVSKNLGGMFLFVITIFIVRGLPVYIRELGPTHWRPKFMKKHAALECGRLEETKEQIALGLYSAAGLPIIVAVTEVAVNSELMSSDDASVLVAAGAITVLVFPFLANQILGKKPIKITANHPTATGEIPIIKSESTVVEGRESIREGAAKEKEEKQRLAEEKKRQKEAEKAAKSAKSSK